MKLKALLKWNFLMIVALGLLGCEKEEPVVVEELPRPVKAYVIGGDEVSEVRRLPARVYASQRAEVSFRVPGLIVELPVKEGDEVEEGQLLAQLDQKDYRTTVNDRKAKFDEAKANYDRGKELVKDGFISKMDFDRLESNFKTTRANLEQARLDLSYTSLKAPFDGQVAKRYVQKNEEVRKKQPIFAMQYTRQLDIKFDLPETLVLRIRQEAGEEKVRDMEKPFAFVRFADGGKNYPMQYKEIATRADQQTRTFEATFIMDTPADLTVLPGMTAQVDLDLVAIFGAADFEVTVPNTAVFADPDGGRDKLVWVIDLDTMTVHKRVVETGRLINNRILIESGLKAGDSVVTAGVHHLGEGEQVRMFTGTFGE